MMPQNAQRLRHKVNQYFAHCRSENSAPTPAGLALALDMRTADLTRAPMDAECRCIIDRALQRIEVSALELLLSKSAARGLEIVLQSSERRDDADPLGGLSDDELAERLMRLARRIGTLPKEEDSSEKEAVS